MKAALLSLFLLIAVESFSQGNISREEWLRRNYEENIELISDTNRVVFRLNWSRAFHPHTIIRIENFSVRLQDTLYVQQFAVSKVYRDEFNDYRRVSRPFLFEQRICEVSKQGLEQLTALANQLNIWKMKSDKVIKLDGSNWELEVYMYGKYHMVSSNSVNPSIKKLGEEMIRLSCLELRKEDIY